MRTRGTERAVLARKLVYDVYKQPVLGIAEELSSAWPRNLGTVRMKLRYLEAFFEMNGISKSRAAGWYRTPAVSSLEFSTKFFGKDDALNHCAITLCCCVADG